MTSIFYGDCVTRSPNGRRTLEARSPHNGTITHRNGNKPHPNEFGYKYRDHQSGFRYQMIDAVSGRVIWERWQENEDSPRELVIANDGWAVIRTHGFRQEVIAVRPDGMDAVRVRIEPSWKNPNRGHVQHSTPTFDWIAEQMVDSTAGYEWAGHSWRYFVRLNDRPCFVWGVWWGDRLVLDLEAGELVPVTPKLVRAVDAAEARGVTAFFDTCLTRIDELTRWLKEPKAKEPEDTPPQYDSLQELAWKITAAARLAGILRVKDCAQALRALESIDLVSSWGSTTSFGDLCWLEQQSFRPIVQHALRQIGEVPAGYPPYHFIVVRNAYDRKDREPVTECVPNRATKLGHLNRDMTPREVLQLVGMPDFIRRGSSNVGEFYRWYEQWEYDTLRGDRWETLQMTWDTPNRQVEMTEFRALDEDQIRSDARDHELFNR